MKNLQNKKVMISAGAAGIGLAIASKFAQAGARVEVCDISEQALADVANSLPGVGVFRADVSQESDVRAWFESALGRMGGLDVLVNNAGIAGPTAAIEDIDQTEWDKTIEVNLRSQFLCVKHAVTHLRASDAGTIINMSSVAGRFGYPLRTPYAASKWAIIGLTQSLALELGADGITVNAILPGIVDSERARLVTQTKAAARGVSVQDMEREILGRVALHSMVPMDHIADTAMFLVSDAGRSVTGQNFNICGGIQSLA